MKNLNKTIDRILKVDPTLEDKLVPIKNKLKKFPSRSMNYWKELLELLNSDPSIVNHPKRTEISKIFTVKKRTPHQQLYSFKIVTPSDHVIGVIPENFADEIKRHDREYIAITKLNVEAVLTENPELKAEVLRRGNLLEIHNKKIWFKLRDHFQLWDRSLSCTIKKQENGLLVMVEPAQRSNMGFPGLGQPQQLPGPSGMPNIFKIDPNDLKQFLQSLGLEPPEE
jgi:hypothetical protein